MLMRRDKVGRSPWLAAGTIIGALAGFTFAPIRLKAGDSLISVSWALGGAVVGLVVGIVLDRHKNRRQRERSHSAASRRPSVSGTPIVGGAEQDAVEVAESQPAPPTPALRWFQFRLRSLLLAMLLVALFFGTDGCGLVGLRYPRCLENDPLLSPVRVLSVQKNTLYLEDGRVLRVDQMLHEGSLDELIKASDNRVDVMRDGSQKLAVFAKERGWICGTPWARSLINLDLIPDDVPINYRVPIGYGTVGASSTKIEKP
jgi:hypothetical protein